MCTKGLKIGGPSARVAPAGCGEPVDEAGDGLALDREVLEVCSASPGQTGVALCNISRCGKERPAHALVMTLV
ncbi:hypothetical protein GCM10018783_16920 [Streptomyces griseosporeus]|nr:hypothetical protein GCM10018783_16920 [Streptomyces griseosporeus]